MDITNSINLPEKLSECIRLALKDEQIMHDSPFYEMDMEVYHQIRDDEHSVCSVCFAGAVIAGTLNTPHDKYVNPINFDEHTANRLYALDYIRTGYIEDALDQLEVSSETHFMPDTKKVRFYNSNRKGWRRDMLTIANELQAQGL
jgi:hypothetical protein